MLRLVAHVVASIGDAGGGLLDRTALGAPLLPERLVTGLPLALMLRGDEGEMLRGLEL